MKVFEEVLQWFCIITVQVMRVYFIYKIMQLMPPETASYVVGAILMWSLDLKSK